MIGMFELQQRVDIPYRVVINEARRPVQALRRDRCAQVRQRGAGPRGARAARGREQLTSAYRHRSTSRMSLGEFDIIARYFASHDHRADVLLGVGDDAAVLDVRAPDRRLVVAIDTIVEGVHFPRSIDASAVGYRALAVNLSDIAAMGAEPAWMTLSLSLPEAARAVDRGLRVGIARARRAARRRARRRRHGARSAGRDGAARRLGRGGPLADALRRAARRSADGVRHSRRGRRRSARDPAAHAADRGDRAAAVALSAAASRASRWVGSCAPSPPPRWMFPTAC